MLTAVRSPHKVTESIEICSVGFQKKPKRQNENADTVKAVSAVYIRLKEEKTNETLLYS